MVCEEQTVAHIAISIGPQRLCRSRLVGIRVKSPRKRRLYFVEQGTRPAAISDRSVLSQTLGKDIGAFPRTKA